jgi:hypothetical protein
MEAKECPSVHNQLVFWGSHVVACVAARTAYESSACGALHQGFAHHERRKEKEKKQNGKGTGTTSQAAGDG